MVQVKFGLGHYINIERASGSSLIETTMALIAAILLITVILALFGAAAQRWGVDTREDRIDSQTPRAGMR